MSTIFDITSMLGCNIRLDDVSHDGFGCYKLVLDMGAGDGRRAEVLLSEDDLTAVVRGIREHDEK